MAISVKKITLWRREMDDRPGTLAQVLAPVASAGTSLRVVMAYRYPEPAGQAAVELAPVTGRKATAAAQGAGLAPAAIGALLVEGDDRPGLAGADALQCPRPGRDQPALPDGAGVRAEIRGGVRVRERGRRGSRGLDHQEVGEAGAANRGEEGPPVRAREAALSGAKRTRGYRGVGIRPL